MVNNRQMNLKNWAGEERGRGLTLAKALGVQPPSVSDWITGKKPVPLAQCMPIERATGGAVTRRDLMPDTYLIHWPELGEVPELAQAQQTPAQAAPESVTASADALPPISDLPPIDTTPAAPAWDGVDRRAPVSKPLPPELERRALVGGV